MKKTVNIFVTLFAFLIATAPLVAQDESNITRIETKDGSIYHGKILSQNNDTIQFIISGIGNVRILKSDVLSISDISSNLKNDRKLWSTSPTAYSYFLAPNGYNLNKGELRFQSKALAINEFAIGVSDHFSISAGLIPTFFYSFPTPAWVSPKFSFSLLNNKINIAAGGIFGSILGLEDAGFNILFSAVSLGSIDRNVSVSVGWSFSRNGFSRSAILNFGTMYRLGPRFYLVGELSNIQEIYSPINLLTLGGRSIINRSSIDYGLLFLQSGFALVPLPWLGLNIPLTKPKG